MSKPKTKAKKKVVKKAAKKKPTPRRRVEKVAPAFNRQISESVATAGKPGPAHDCGPEWDPFYEWIKPLSSPALVAGIENENHVLGYPKDEKYELWLGNEIGVLRAELTRLAKARHDAGIPYEWPDNVHDYYPEPPAPSHDETLANVATFNDPRVAKERAPLVQNIVDALREDGLVCTPESFNPAESNDLCKDPGDGELDTLAHIITNLGYGMRAARYVRRRAKEGDVAAINVSFILREADRCLSEAISALNAAVNTMREPAGDKN